MANMKIGVFVPPPLESGDKKSIHSPGIGRITMPMYDRLRDLLSQRHDGVEFVQNVSFRNSAIVNGDAVFLDAQEPLQQYFWYSEIDRKPNSYDLTFLKMLDRRIPVRRNPDAYIRALDKHLSFAQLRDSGVPVADSVLVDASNTALIESVVRSWGMVLLKPRRGGFGKGVTLLDGFESVRDTLEYIQTTATATTEGGFHLERFYDNDIDRWTSVTVIGGRIVYGYRKNKERFVSLGKGKFKVYDTDEIGGSVSICEVTDAHEKAALAAYKALGLEIVGFDMIWHEGAPIVVDVNTFPGMYQDLFDQQRIDGGQLMYNIIAGRAA